MTTPSAPPVADPVADLDAAHRAHAAATTARADGPIDQFTFSGQLNFLVTIGYLTKDQASALFEWFTKSGMMKLPALPDPAGASSPSMYETLSTSIHFGTPPGATDPATHGVLSDIGDFFSGLLDSVGDLIGTTLDAVTTTLQAGTALVQAGSVLVGQLHTLAV
jgi:hypothetical protein